MTLKKIIIISLLFILTIGAVNASDDVNSLQAEPNNEINQDIISLENTYEIDDTNYDTYFDENGKTNENISNGDTIRLGNLTNKEICIDKSLTITPITSNDELINSMIILISGSDNSIINGIKIINNNDTQFKHAIVINDSNNVTITQAIIDSIYPIDSHILINSSKSIKVVNSTFINSGDTYIVIINATNNCTGLIVGYNTIIIRRNTIISEDLTKIEKNASKFEAKFVQKDNPLSFIQVSFIINGVNYKRTTDDKGIARIAINLEPGNYTIQSINSYSGEVKNNTITVLPRIVENNDLEKFYRNDSQYWIKILDDNGNPVGANETVTFNINGVFYNRTTNASGYVKLNINLQPGEYIITAEYKGCRVSNNITVKPVLFAENLTKKFNTSDQFKAKLLDGKGNPLANTNVTFNIHGVFYTRTTDSEGIARLNINLQPGEYIITSSYNGTNVANKVTVTE